MLSTGTTAKRVHSLKRTRINLFAPYLTIEYAGSVLLPESVIAIHKSTLRTCMQSAFSMPKTIFLKKIKFFRFSSRIWVPLPEYISGGQNKAFGFNSSGCCPVRAPSRNRNLRLTSKARRLSRKGPSRRGKPRKAKRARRTEEWEAGQSCAL